MITFKQYLVESKNGLRKKIGLEFQFGSRVLLLNDTTDIPITSENGVAEVEKFFKRQQNVERHNVNTFKTGMKYASLFIFQDIRKKANVVFVLYVKDNNSIVVAKKLDPKLKIKGGTESLGLKPQSFGIKEVMSYAEFLGSLRSKIPAQKGLSAQLKAYLNYLVDNAEGITNSPPKIDGLPLAQIGKNFGELTGPIKLFNNKIFSIKFHKPNDVILFPLAGNNKLLDYAIQQKDGIIHNFSAKYKSGAATSLSSIIDIIKDNKRKFTKLTKEVEVVNLINENTAETGVIELAQHLKLMNKKERKLWNDGDFDDNIFEKFKQELTPNLDKAISKFWILAGVAKKVARKLNDDYDFDTLIKKAMALSSVHQISMTIDNKGVPSYKIASDNTGDDSPTKKWQIDAGKSFFASSTPVQKLSFKLK